MKLPARLDIVLDDLHCGAWVQHVETRGLHGWVIDFRPNDGAPIVAVAANRFRSDKNEKLPSKPKHYRAKVIEERMEDWLVLANGPDEEFLLVE